MGCSVLIMNAMKKEQKLEKEMAAFQKNKENTENKVMLRLMSHIEANPSVSQRALASELGIALGLMNNYIKRCIKKGWLRASQVPAKRFAYYLTPEGFREKSRMVAHYVSNSLSFFRDARSQCQSVFEQCKNHGWEKIALVGDGDLSEIARLVAHGFSLQLSLEALSGDFNKYDAVLITDIMDPQDTYDCLKDVIDDQRLLTLNVLHISRAEIGAMEKAS